MISSITPINFTSNTIPKPATVTKLLSLDTFESKQANYYSRYKECFDWNNFSRIKLFEKFNTFEKKIFQSELNTGMDQFFATALGYKPAFLLPKPHFIRKITSLTNQPLDIWSYDTTKNKRIIIFNRNATKEQIEKNKNIYTDLLGLNSNSTTNEIYNALIHSKDLISGPALLGITLGFPVADSLIFGLEDVLHTKGIDTIELREHVEDYKTEALKLLKSDDCPYQSDKLKEELEKYISQIQNIKPQVKLYLRYISFLENSSEQNDKKLNEYIDNFSINMLV